VTNPGDRHHLGTVVDRIDDPIVARTYAPRVGHPDELLAAWRAGIIAKPSDSVHDLLEIAALQVPELLGHVGLELHRIWHLNTVPNLDPIFKS